MSAWMFLKDVVRRPGQMGAIAPSGRQLARRMVEAVDIQPGQTIVELGAGTGAITEMIVELAPDNPLLAMEPGEELAAALERRFPQIQVTRRLAHELPEVLPQWGYSTVDRVVSGLPWTLWPDSVQTQILNGVVSCMADNAKLVTFTYVHSQVLPGAGVLKQLLSRYFHEVQTTPIAWKNLPPAFAYVASGPRRN